MTVRLQPSVTTAPSKWATTFLTPRVPKQPPQIVFGSGEPTAGGDQPSGSRARRWAGRLGIGAFAFFAIKGLLWLVLGGSALAALTRGCGGDNKSPEADPPAKTARP